VLYDITIRSTRSEKNIVCTKNHRWILNDGTVTTSLSVGDTLYALHDSTAAERQMSQREAEMFALGFVLGDGTDLPHGLQVRLCGHKTQYKDIFLQAGYQCREIDGGDLVLTKACDFSKQDFLEKSIWNI